MTFPELVGASLLSPPVLCFALGVVAVLLRSDLRMPEPVFNALSIYLLLAIGLKGGADLAKADLASVLLPSLAALALGVSIPLWTYAFLRRIAGFASADAAAIAAHYGSVSAVTFIAVIGYLDASGTAYEGFVTALLAIMEVPAIVVALILARWAGASQSEGGLRQALGEVVSGKSILLLVGGLIIGFAAGPEGLQPGSRWPFSSDSPWAERSYSRPWRPAPPISRRPQPSAWHCPRRIRAITSAHPSA
jgi:hypothetical protein